MAKAESEDSATRIGACGTFMLTNQGARMEAGSLMRGSGGPRVSTRMVCSGEAVKFAALGESWNVRTSRPSDVKGRAYLQSLVDIYSTHCAGFERLTDG